MACKTYRTMAWFFFLVLAGLHVAVLVDPPDTTGYAFLALERLGWTGVAAGFYFAYRRQARPWAPIAALVGFTWLVGAGALLREGPADGWPFAVVPALAGAAAMFLNPGRPDEEDDLAQAADEANPDATADLVREHAARLRAAGKEAEAEKLEARAARIAAGTDPSV